jgi:hypothetical protein
MGVVRGRPRAPVARTNPPEPDPRVPEAVLATADGASRGGHYGDTRLQAGRVTKRAWFTIGVVMGLTARASDESLLAATQAGDAEAFGVFFERHSRTVLRFVRRRVGSAELAADLTAETFAAALIAVHRDHAREVPDGAAWLCGIAPSRSSTAIAVLACRPPLGSSWGLSESRPRLLT